MTEIKSVSSTPPDTALIVISWIFSAILGISVALALGIILLPSGVFLAISNYLQVLTAFAGAVVFLFAYYRYGKPGCLLYATGAFGLWGVSNIVWYVNTLLGRRNDVFPSLVDIGMIAAIFILTIAYQHVFPRKQVAGKVLLAVLAISFLIPIVIIIMTGLTLKTGMTFLYFIACGSLVLIGLIHSLSEYPAILVGTLLFAIAFMVYPVRETFFIINPYLNLLGVLVIAGFALITLGLIPAARTVKAS